MELIETPIFTKRIVNILSDDEYGDMQWLLSEQEDLTYKQLRMLKEYVKGGVL